MTNAEAAKLFAGLPPDQTALIIVSATDTKEVYGCELETLGINDTEDRQGGGPAIGRPIVRIWRE